ncbi:cilia- and flagella-associated protein 47-like [Thalassophryne amazonica]|uniref:cilia- and flagella-associated protein 47-like n=1 Tax=Thalassophryne amazonica TaxID=390379 RepID=UPI00147177EE|nr:cilia- and flagella-associated protein 47-like [Thalassophryne amazonica]
MAREQALAIWGQLSMSAEEHRRRMLTQTMHSSTLRAAILARKLTKQQVHLLRSVGVSDGVEYSVAVSLPAHFKLPTSVTMPIRKDSKIQLEDNPAELYHITITSECLYFSFNCSSSPACVSSSLNSVENECLEIPFQFKADSAGQFTCQLSLRSWWDTWVYLLVVLATPQGKLSIYNDHEGTKPMLTLRGIGEHRLPVDHVVLHCTVGQTTTTQLIVPNFTQNKLALQVMTDLSVVSGSPSLMIKPGCNTPYSLAVSPWKRGKHSGDYSLSLFVIVSGVNE